MMRQGHSRLGRPQLRSTTDTSDNKVTATQIIDILDMTPPTITAPADVTAEYTDVLTTVFIGTVTATDIADPNPVIRNDAPESFPTGDIPVTWTATDSRKSGKCYTKLVKKDQNFVADIADKALKFVPENQKQEIKN